MGDRYTLHGLKCGHCGAEQEEVYYAPSSGFLTHRCEKCREQNIIQQGFTLRADERKKAYEDGKNADNPLIDKLVKLSLETGMKADLTLENCSKFNGADIEITVLARKA